MRIKILSSAVADLYAGGLFYEIHGTEAGEYFFNSLFSDIDSLALHGGIHPKVFEYHRLLSKRFPYAVYYTKEDDLIVVWRVLDLRQDPKLIRKELKLGEQGGRVYRGQPGGLGNE